MKKVYFYGDVRILEETGQTVIENVFRSSLSPDDRNTHDKEYFYSFLAEVF